MFKNVFIALLLVAFGVVAGHSDSASSHPTSPVIVQRVVLTNQTGPIPITTLITPQQDGLYRLSAYMSLTRGGGTNNGIFLDFAWTDGGGPKEIFPLQLTDTSFPSFAWGPANNMDGILTFKANAGTPVTYRVAFTDPPPTGTYEIMLTLERLI